MISGTWKRVLLAWAIGGFVAGLAIMPLCDLHFDCGCRWPGLGGWKHCDIHTAGPPDCPWCVHFEAFTAVMALTYAVALAGTFKLSARLPFAGLVVVSLAIVLGSGVIVGIATSLILGRPVLAGL